MVNFVKTLAVDSLNIAYRSFFKLPKFMNNDSGMRTSVIYGFLNSLNSLYYKFNPENLVLVWDSRRNFRKEWDSTYKQRPKVDDFDQFVEQIIELKEWLPEIGIPCLEIEGYEADDILALIAIRDGLKPMAIVTSDTDCYQTLYPNVVLYNGKELFDMLSLKKEYGFTHPIHYTVFKSMTGCSTDTVPGIRGIGKDRALKIFKECDYDIGKIYQKIDKLGYGEEFNKALTLIVNPLGFDFTVPLEVRQCEIDLRKVIELFMEFNIQRINPHEFLRRK